MPSTTQNVSNYVLTNPYLASVDLNLTTYCLNPSFQEMVQNESNAIKNTKCISTNVDQTYPLKAKTQNVSQHELTIHIPSQRGHKMLLKMC